MQRHYQPAWLADDHDQGCEFRLRGTGDYGGLGVLLALRVGYLWDLLVVPNQLRRAVHLFQEDREGRWAAMRTRQPSAAPEGRLPLFSDHLTIHDGYTTFPISASCAGSRSSTFRFSRFYSSLQSS